MVQSAGSFPTRREYFTLAKDRAQGGALTHPILLRHVPGLTCRDAVEHARIVHGGVWREATPEDIAASAQFWERVS